MKRLVVAAALLSGCTLHPWVHIDSPTQGALVRDPEVTVEGSFDTYDGRAWIWVDNVEAELSPGRFRARLELGSGKVDVTTRITDGSGASSTVKLHLRVENPARPRSAERCTQAGVCLRYETRGTPRRDGRGLVSNAVLVLTPLGFDERLDELWPDLVGPERPLDVDRLLILGVAPARHKDGLLASPAEAIAALEELVDELKLSRPLRVVGASSLGAEWALAWLAEGRRSIGRLVVCGGHDAPSEEEALHELDRRLKEDPPSGRGDARFWARITPWLVDESYTEEYLANPANALEHGLEKQVPPMPLRQALVDKLGRHFTATVDARDLLARVRLAPSVVRWPELGGTWVRLLANRRDRTISTARVEVTAQRLRGAHATVELKLLDDAHGHSVFYHLAPEALAQALKDLVQP